MLFGLGVLWLVSEIMHRDKEEEVRKKLTIFNIVKKVDTPTIFFFLGILSAVAALQSAGHLSLLAGWLDEKLGDIYLINLAIGAISAVVDNVPLVAGAMGMYEVVTPDMLRWPLIRHTQVSSYRMASSGSSLPTAQERAEACSSSDRRQALLPWASRELTSYGI
ncbi:MAG: SLC13 family permease [Bacteroidales bacterium]